MNEAEKIWMDGEMVDWHQAKVHVLAHVLHYGSGVFEGIRMYKLTSGPNAGKSAVFRLNDHTVRLINSAKIYEMSVPYSIEDINHAICDTLRVNHLESAYIRPLIFRGYGSIGLDPTQCPVNMIIAAFEFGTYLGKEGIENGIKACIASWNRPAVNTIPSLAKASGNYLSSQLIRLEAKQNGYQEGISMDINGYIAEGSGENIFVVKDGMLYTTPFSDSILPGITRHSVTRIAKEYGIEIKENRIPREFLYLADEIFMVGTAAEITPVVQIDQYKIGDGKRGPITKLLQDGFFGIVTGVKPDAYNWLTVV